MVQVGFFTLELVRAETNQGCNEKFTEHTDPRGNVYVEVEPEEEYYLRLSSNVTKVVYVDIYVEGEKIETGRRLDAKSQVKAGIYARSQHKHAKQRAIIEKALKFEKAPTYGPAEIQDDLPYWTGNIEVVFFGDPKCVIFGNPKCVNARKKKRKLPETSSPKIYYSARENLLFNLDRSSTAEVGCVRGITNIKHQKGLVTEAGTTILSKSFLKDPSQKRPMPNTREPQITREPQKLGSISVQYCSTVGLIHCGILPKPDLWEGYLEALKYQGLQRTDDWKTLSETKCVKKEISSGRIDRAGNVSNEYSTVDFFDLSRED